RVRKDRLMALKDIRLSVTWDNEARAAIDLSAADLFAAWTARPDPSSLALSSREIDDSVELTLTLPLPFATRASWKLENRAAFPIPVALKFDVMPEIPHAGLWRKLEVQRNETIDNPLGLAHPIAKRERRGRLVGVCGDLKGHGFIKDQP